MAAKKFEISRNIETMQHVNRCYTVCIRTLTLPSSTEYIQELDYSTAYASTPNGKGAGLLAGISNYFESQSKASVQKSSLELSGMEVSNKF